MVPKYITHTSDLSQILFQHPAPSRSDARPSSISGHRVVVVSSGAIGVGCLRLGIKTRPSAMAQKQALAAVGQVHLMRYYEDFFSAVGLVRIYINPYITSRTVGRLIVLYPPLVECRYDTAAFAKGHVLGCITRWSSCVNYLLSLVQGWTGYFGFRCALSACTLDPRDARLWAHCTPSDGILNDLFCAYVHSNTALPVKPRYPSTHTHASLRKAHPIPHICHVYTLLQL